MNSLFIDEELQRQGSRVGDDCILVDLDQWGTWLECGAELWLDISYYTFARNGLVEEWKHSSPMCSELVAPSAVCQHCCSDQLWGTPGPQDLEGRPPRHTADEDLVINHLGCSPCWSRIVNDELAPMSPIFI